jgi:hypothetical protein
MSPEELKEYWAGVKELEPLQIEYRVHYNELGEIVMCTMTEHPNTSNYLVVTKNEYDHYFHYLVVNGKLKKIDKDTGHCVQLKKSVSGHPTVAGHAGLLIEATETFENIEYYERNN